MVKARVRNQEMDLRVRPRVRGWMPEPRIKSEIAVKGQNQKPRPNTRGKGTSQSHRVEPRIRARVGGSGTEQKDRDKAGKQAGSTVAASKELTQLYRQHPVPLSGLNNAVRLNQWGWALLQLGLQSARGTVPLATQHTNY